MEWISITFTEMEMDSVYFSRYDPVLVFTAAMDYFPNIDAVQFFCRDIFPKDLRVVSSGAI